MHEGETATFDCQITEEGVTDVDYEWFYNSRSIVIPEGSRRRVQGPRLTIDSVKLADIGNYACKASNSAGYAYDQTTLSVIRKYLPLSLSL